MSVHEQFPLQHKVLEKIPLLGAVTWLMMQQSSVRHTFISQLEWRVMPPLVLEQCKMYLRDGAPVAFASWARLSDEAAIRYGQAPYQLMPSEWRSGEQVWLIDLIAPFGADKEVLRDLRENVLAGSNISRLSPDGAGQVQTEVWLACPRNESQAQPEPQPRPA